MGLAFYTALFVLQSFFAVGESATPVYGYQGAMTSLASGRSLHYLINLNKCTLTAGPDPPELADPFGGMVETYRTFNDREISDLPFAEFYEQRLTYNNTGRLVQLSRKITVWQNDSVEVATAIFTPDFVTMSYMTSHLCTMSTEQAKGDVDLFQGGVHPPVMSYSDLKDSYLQSEYMHFSASVFLCQGGQEHTFSTFGGRISNFELMMDSGTEFIESSLNHVVHYLPKMDRHVLDAINMRVYENGTVAISDSRGMPPAMDRTREHTSFCTMFRGMPGGTTHFYSSA